MPFAPSRLLVQSSDASTRFFGHEKHLVGVILQRNQRVPGVDRVSNVHAQSSLRSRERCYDMGHTYDTFVRPSEFLTERIRMLNDR